MVAGIDALGGGAPGISGLSEESCVALAGVVNTTLGTPIPPLPEQPASTSKATSLPTVSVFRDNILVLPCPISR